MYMKSLKSRLLIYAILIIAFILLIHFILVYTYYADMLISDYEQKASHFARQSLNSILSSFNTVEESINRFLNRYETNELPYDALNNYIVTGLFSCTKETVIQRTKSTYDSIFKTLITTNPDFLLKTGWKYLKYDNKEYLFYTTKKKKNENVYFLFEISLPSLAENVYVKKNIFSNAVSLHLYVDNDMTVIFSNTYTLHNKTRFRTIKTELHPENKNFYLECISYYSYPQNILTNLFLIFIISYMFLIFISIGIISKFSNTVVTRINKLSSNMDKFLDSLNNE